ncbi:pilus assembly PilX N-terminal domain-containing protein [Natranaerobius trueperi]|uniref:Uncharacterized protein n=1 Tax=Natranaerobius trueperi TaxID=759412 RepID=A0A226BYD8_9FIRM|nr:pilus assembly PilX N-terminal domain-containing protein [Natranaerobius trueperi]OWZ84048.1 hypothetical protein CDO51_05675 [Natranaerobius trueperi]
MFNKLRNNQCGSVLIMSLVILMILSLLGKFLLDIVFVNSQIAKGYGDGVKAYYNASSGIQYAKKHLQDEWDKINKMSIEHDINTDGHSFTVDIETVNRNSKNIKSTGMFENANRTLISNIERTFFINFELLEEMMEYAILAKNIYFDHTNYSISGKVLYQRNFKNESDIKEPVIYYEPEFLDSIELRTLDSLDIKQYDGENESIELNYGDLYLDYIPHDPYFLIVLEDSNENGNITIQEGVLEKYQDNTLVILAAGKIFVEENNLQSINSEGYTLLYSEERGTGIKLLGDNIAINGSLIAPKGDIVGKNISRLRINNLNLNYSPLYKLETTDFKYHIRRN